MTDIKNWPVWLRRLGIISLIIVLIDIITLLYVWMRCFSAAGSCDGFGEWLFTVIILLPILGIMVLCWVIGFLAHYFNSKGKKWFNVILMMGTVASGLIVMFTIAEYFGFFVLGGESFRFYFPLPFSLPLFFFFAITTSVNLKKYRADKELGV